jgi:hypothetical protein
MANRKERRAERSKSKGKMVRVPAHEVMNPILDAVIKPNAEAVARIAYRGAVVVAVHEPSQAMIAMLDALGWDGKAPIFEMAEDVAERVAKNSLPHDPITANWLRSGRQGRVFIVTQSATLLCNHVEDRGWSFEPGSLDHEYLN